MLTLRLTAARRVFRSNGDWPCVPTATNARWSNSNSWLAGHRLPVHRTHARRRSLWEPFGELLFYSVLEFLLNLELSLNCLCCCVKPGISWIVLENLQNLELSLNCLWSPIKPGTSWIILENFKNLELSLSCLWCPVKPGISCIDLENLQNLEFLLNCLCSPGKPGTSWTMLRKTFKTRPCPWIACDVL